MHQLLLSVVPIRSDLGLALASDAGDAGAVRDERLHVAGNAFGRELFLEDVVDLAVFVGVFHLDAAILDAHVGGRRRVGCVDRFTGV